MTQKWRWRNDGISLSKLSACGATRYEGEIPTRTVEPSDKLFPRCPTHPGKGPSFALSADVAISLEEVRDCDCDAQDVRLLDPTAGGWHSLLRLFVEFCVFCVFCVLCVYSVYSCLCLCSETLLPKLRNASFACNKEQYS